MKKITNAVGSDGKPCAISVGPGGYSCDCSAGAKGLQCVHVKELDARLRRIWARPRLTPMKDWDGQGHPLDTLWMRGEGYQVSCPPELTDKHAYDLDAWAEKWLKDNSLPVRRDTTAHKRDSGRKLVITTVDWKTEALEEDDYRRSQEAARRARRPDSYADRW